MSPEQEQELLKIGRAVAQNCRLEDKEEAFSIALLGVAKGLASYVPNKKTKLSTYLYKCAQFEVWAEWRKLHRVKRGSGVKEISLDEMKEKGWEV
jgi:RNA polymerase sporulation-specific sigma factor